MGEVLLERGDLVGRVFFSREFRGMAHYNYSKYYQVATSQLDKTVSSGSLPSKFFATIQVDIDSI